MCIRDRLNVEFPWYQGVSISGKLYFLPEMYSFFYIAFRLLRVIISQVTLTLFPIFCFFTLLFRSFNHFMCQANYTLSLKCIVCLFKGELYLILRQAFSRSITQSFKLFPYSIIKSVFTSP